MTETFRPAFPGQDRPMISYGLPFPESLDKHAEETFHASRVYVICSGSLARNTGQLDGLKAKLGDKLAGVRIGMRPHTHWSEILEVAAEAQKLQVDLLVTLGGGSLTDAAKIVSYALANNALIPEALSTLYPTSPNAVVEPNPSVVPVVCIPTALSGAEYSFFAGATNDTTRQKHSFHGPGIRGPALIILDPALAALTPPRIWLSTGVKAVDHCVETLCSVHSDSNEAADDDARRGLARLIPGLLRSVTRDGEGRGSGSGKGEEGREDLDLDARLMAQLGAIDAMSAASVRGVSVGASHGIGHQLGPAGVGHGETSCVLLPAVCAFNYARGANVARQDAVAAELWQQPVAAELFEARGFRRPRSSPSEGESEGEGKGTPLSDLLDAFIRALGMPRTLKEVGVGEDKLDGIAEHSLLDRWTKTNPAPLDKDAVLEILRMVLG